MRLLATGEDDQGFISPSGVTRVGDRLYFGVAEGASGPFAATTEDSVVSVGLCGESPATAGTGVRHVSERPQYPGVPLACAQEDFSIVRLEPMGAEAPRVVFGPDACHGMWGAEYIVGVEGRGAGTGAIVTWELPEDLDGPPVQPRVLLDGIRGYTTAAIAVYDDEVFAIDLEERLVRVALADGTVSVELEGAVRFSVSPDRRFLAYLASYEEVFDGFSRGELVVVDRETGRQAVLPEANLGLLTTFGANGYVRVWLGQDPEPAARIFDLERFELHEVPDDLIAWRAIPDGRWILSDQARVSFWLRELDTAEMVHLPIVGRPNISRTWTVGDEWFELIDAHGFRGPLRRVHYESATAELVADEVRHGFLRLDDGRIVTDRGGKQLVVIDPAARGLSLLARHTWGGPLVAGPELRLGGLDVVYGVGDGAQSGIWRARLMP